MKQAITKLISLATTLVIFLTCGTTTSHEAERIIQSKLPIAVQEVTVETTESTVAESIPEPTISETIPEPTTPEIVETMPLETTVQETEPAVEETEPIITEYEYGRRMTPAVEIDPSNGVKNFTEEVDTSTYEYYGRMFITGYAPTCEHCCGSTAGITASGVEAISGYTIAAGYEFDFGTTLYIEGYGYYVVEDRGNLGENVLDIAVPDHKSSVIVTSASTGINVYVVPNNHK